MLAESDGDDRADRIPDTLQALIAARIDQPAAAGEGAAAPRGRDRPDLLARRDRPRRARPRGRRAAGRPAAARLRPRRAAVDDHRRARVPLQAHADPRGRVRRADEGRARRAARGGSPSGSASGRATSCSRSAPTTSTMRRSCSPSSTGRRPPSSPPRPPPRSRRPAGARSPASRTAPAASCSLRAVELEPTLERRYHAARAAWRLSDLPARLGRDAAACSTRRARRATRTIEGKALTALAEVALLREANLPKATELIDAALEALPDGRALHGARGARPDRLVGRRLRHPGARGAEALEIAHRLERKDLEAHALNELARSTASSSRLDEAEELRARGLELAEESGSIVARAQALHSLGCLHLDRSEPVVGEQLLEEARMLFAEVGDAWMRRAHAERAGLGGRAAGRRRRGPSGCCARRSAC